MKQQYHNSQVSAEEVIVFRILPVGQGLVFWPNYPSLGILNVYQQLPRPNKWLHQEEKKIFRYFLLSYSFSFSSVRRYSRISSHMLIGFFVFLVQHTLESTSTFWTVVFP
jgi:hypothetical protein